MQSQSLRSVLEREHREVDAGLINAEDRPALTRAMGALRRHIYAEEVLLFPSLRDAGMVGPILVMLREHAQMWATLDTLDLRLDTGASGEQVAALCRELLAQLQAHNPKEEAILYPQADDLLDADALSRLRMFLDSGQLPTGWTCPHPAGVAISPRGS